MTEATDAHICSESVDRCPSCGHEESRDAFEGWEGTRRDAAHNRAKFVVRCPKCEALHPDQSSWDDRDCEPCFYRQIEDDRVRRVTALDEGERRG